MLPPAFNHDSPEWERLWHTIEANSVNTDQLKELNGIMHETREAFLVSNGVLSERMTTLSDEFHRLSVDVDKNNSNHAQDIKRLDVDLADFRMESNDKYVSHRDLKIWGSVATGAIIISLWFFNHFQAKDTDSLVQAVKQLQTIVQPLIKEVPKL